MSITKGTVAASPIATNTPLTSHLICVMSV
jgi:hypothetical protein